MNKSDVHFKVGYYANQLKPDVKINFYIPDYGSKKCHFIVALYAKDSIEVPYYVVDYWFDGKDFNVIIDFD